MVKKYQVFVSSTYEDLKKERDAVSEALRNNRYIVSSMETFPASHTKKGDVIQREIEESDYLVVIIAGKYGSVDETGVSYTEKEYDYAGEIGVPAYAFIQKDEAIKEQNRDSDETNLNNFKDRLKTKVCKFWEGERDLTNHVISSINDATKTNPRPGYIRGDATISPTMETKEMPVPTNVPKSSKQIDIPNLIDKWRNFDRIQFSMREGGPHIIFKDKSKPNSKSKGSSSFNLRRISKDYTDKDVFIREEKECHRFLLDNYAVTEEILDELLGDVWEMAHEQLV
jgi:hypothetical protein